MRTPTRSLGVVLGIAVCFFGLASCRQENGTRRGAEERAQAAHTEGASLASPNSAPEIVAETGQSRGQGEPLVAPAVQHGLALTVTCPQGRFGPNEPIPLTYTVRNQSTEPIYASMACGALLYDAQGERVIPPGPLDKPPEVPGDLFIEDEKGQLTIQVETVYLLEPGGDHTETVPDALRIYHPIPRGDYEIVAVAGVRVYSPEAVITRPEMPHKTWADPKSAKVQFQLEQRVPLEIR